MQGTAEVSLAVRWNPELNSRGAAAVVELINATVQDDGTLGFAEPLSAPAAEAFVDSVAQRVKSGSSHVLLAMDGERPVLFVILTPFATPNCRHIAELSKGVVHPDYRGRGFARRAFIELVKKARSLGVEQFVLDVREGTLAHKLWSKLGFRTFGVLEDYARVKDISYRGHYMVQSVQSLSRNIGIPTQE